jgi:2-C-methyl-D-erythritol 4-phosphate cytidylyltransferase
MTEKCVALILAGGKGTRFNSMRPKQYMEVDGMPVISYTMRQFQTHHMVTDICVVCSPEWNEYIERQAATWGFDKFRQCLPSGDTSFLSMRNGIDGLAQSGFHVDSIVMVHDAVRPLITHDIIDNNIHECRAHGNAITVVYSNESYMRVAGGNEAVGYAMREEYMRAQTPNTFRLSALRHLMDEADRQGIGCSQSLFTLACELGYGPLYIAQGDILNFKITQPQDLKYFRALKDV